EVTVRRLDVSQRVEARAFVAAALRDHERIDVLVNNAGLGWMGRMHEMPEDKIDELIATNVKGVIATTQAAMPSMVQPRRDVMVLPYRLAHLAEPVFGGLLDHALGEARRMKSPHVGASPPPADERA